MDARAIAIAVLGICACGAAAQTREELASLDYGSCPTGYEETILSRFQNSPAGQNRVGPTQRVDWSRQHQ